MNTSGKSFADHWLWAAEKGLMNRNTAKALRAACAQVLGVLDDWESVDVRTLDMDDVFRRFQQKRGSDFIPESLETYRRRVSAAHASFLGYANDPSRWRPPFRARGGTIPRQPKSPLANLPSQSASAALPAPAIEPQRAVNDHNLVAYPFPLRDDLFIQLRLPSDLKMADVRRLTAFLASLAVDAAPV